MDEEMNLSELLVKEAKENELRKILLMIKESNSLEELEEKIKALLNKWARRTK